jgi:hypothetical protein
VNRAPTSYQVNFFSLFSLLSSFIVPHLIGVSFASNDKWNISSFGRVYDPVKEPQLAQVSTLRKPKLKYGIRNCDTMKLNILFRNPDGSKPQYSSNSEPSGVVWRVTNIENNTPADVQIKICRFITRDELEYSYTIPFFNHQIQCFDNGKELNGSPLQIKLSSVAESLNCSACGALAVQAHRTESSYQGLCSGHISYLTAHPPFSQWNQIPQKCNLGK